MRHLELEKDFEFKMLEIYKKTNEDTSYNPIGFAQMISRFGGLKTAKILLNADKVSDGFIRLCKLERLDLSAEYLSLAKEYRPLFTDKELDIARTRINNADSEFYVLNCKNYDN
jgi:hypothetical protein